MFKVINHILLLHLFIVIENRNVRRRTYNSMKTRIKHNQQIRNDNMKR